MQMFRSVGIFRIFSAAVVCSVYLLPSVGQSELPAAEETCRSVLNWIETGEETSGIEDLSAGIREQLETTLSLNGSELRKTAAAADCIHFMKLAQTTEIDPELTAWLLGSPERLHSLMSALTEEDFPERVFNQLKFIYRSDPKERDRWTNLMFALTLVWDKAKRPTLHHQMGEKPPIYKNVIVQRYRYFKKVYGSGIAKIPYEQLDIGDLIFVVDTPVPIAELEWALEHEDEELENWGDLFYKIRYDHYRVDNMMYDWPYGRYVLPAIAAKGGICVDQAYYAMMTARAYGIPALYFCARGNTGGHAWFSYMTAPGEWNLSVGRYEEGEYTTGNTINPQTNKRMTDHDVRYLTECAAEKDDRLRAEAYVSIAETLSDDPDLLCRCTRQARNAVEMYLPAWELEFDVLLARRRFHEAQELFNEQKDVFRDYPDLLADSAEQIRIALLDAGLEEEAEQISRMLVRNVDRERDDLMRSFGMDGIDRLLEEGNAKKARRQLERLIEDNILQGNKLFPMVDRYLEITEESGQSREAVRFIEEYVEALEKEFFFSPHYTCRMYGLLAQAYENNGDDDDLAQVEQRIERIESR